MTALLLTACATPEIRHSVSWPLQAPLAERQVAVAAPLVTSREESDEALERNRAWVRLAAAELAAAVQRQGLAIDPVSPLVVACRIHLAYEKTRLKTPQGTRWQPGFVEVQLELKDLASNSIRYSTFSKTPLEASLFARWFGWGPTNDEFIEQTVRGAIAQFAARLGAPTASDPASPPSAGAAHSGG